MKTPGPAAPPLAGALGSVVALIIAFGHLGPAAAAALTSLAAALGTLAVIGAGARAGKPVSLQAVTGAAAVIFADLALFGIHMSPDERGSLAAVTGLVLSVALHLVHVTVTAAPAPVPAPEASIHDLLDGRPGPGAAA